MNRPAFALLSSLFLTGCAAHPRGFTSTVCAQPKPMQVASAQVCKHCNCIMPAGTNWDAKCTVCDCGYLGHQCLRGSRQ